MMAFSFGFLLSSELPHACSNPRTTYWIHVSADYIIFRFTKWQVIEAGANALVAGSAVFGAKDYAEGMASFFSAKWHPFSVIYLLKFLDISFSVDKI
jgi:hypothetical protein